MRSDRPTTNYGDEGLMYVRPMNSSESNIRRSFISFEFDNCLETGAPPPPKSGLLEAKLSMSNVGDGVSRNHTIARVDASWDELSLTWDTQPAVSEESDSVAASAEEVEWDVTADVSDMLYGVVQNDGWRISVEDEESSGDSSAGTRYATREDSMIDDNAPRLILTYDLAL